MQTPQARNNLFDLHCLLTQRYLFKFRMVSDHSTTPSIKMKKKAMAATASYDGAGSCWFVASIMLVMLVFVSSHHPVTAESIRGAATDDVAPKDDNVGLVLIVNDADEKAAQPQSHHRHLAGHKLNELPRGPNNLFYLENVLHEGKVLDVHSANCRGGQNVQIWDQNWSNAQFWYMDTSNRIRFAKCPSYALEIKNNECGNGATAQLGHIGSSGVKPEQVFDIYRFDDGKYYTVRKRSCSSTGLSLSGTNVVNRWIDGYGHKPETNAQWKLHYVERFFLQHDANKDEEKDMDDESDGTDRVMEVENGSCNDGTYLMLGTRPSGNAVWRKQLFFYNPLQKKIMSFKCLKPLDVKHRACSHGASIQLWSGWDYNAQAWDFDVDKTNYQTIKRSQCTDRDYLLGTFYGGKVELNDKLVVQHYRNRMWRVVKVPTEEF